jgi:hypothetical protein
MTHNYGDSLAWSDLTDEHRETVTVLVGNLGLGNPEIHWSQLDYSARWESTWRFEHPHEDFGMYQAEIDRLNAQADPATTEAFLALPYTNGAAPFDDDDDRLRLIDWSQVHNSDDDVVEGLVMRSRWTQFIAAAKDGKSSLLAWIAICLSEGRDPWDEGLTEPYRVLWCDGEMGRLDLEELIRDLGHDPAALTHFYATEDQLRLDRAAGAEKLLDAVDLLGIDVVVFDGLNSFITAESSENSSETWLPFMKHTIRPLKVRGCAIVSADNLGKDRTRGSRGSSIKTDKADGVVAVHRTDKGVRLQVTHARGGVFLRDDLNLEAEGFDRSVPIRYWRVSGSWPAGTALVAKMLDELAIPVSDGRVKIRARLKEEIATAEKSGSDASGFQVRNDTLSAAIRYRRQSSIRSI